MSAHWTVTEDPEMVTVRIGLWNGHNVVLAAWKDDSASPFVALTTTEHGEYDLSALDFAAFKRWLDGAQERRQTRQPAR
jgi:hypothetical protein